jgi:hypothetical protein
MRNTQIKLPILVIFSLLSFGLNAQIVKKISKEEESKIREILGKDNTGLPGNSDAPKKKGFNFFKDGEFNKDQYNKKFNIKRDSQTIEEIRLSRTTQVDIVTCYDNEMILTVHPDYYDDVTISMEKLSRPDNFEFDPIFDNSGAMKGGAIRTKAYELGPGQRIEGQLSIQIDQTKEWYNIVLHAEACPAGKLEYLRMVYFRPDKKRITSESNLLTPQDKFIELTYPLEETDINRDFEAKIGDVIASPNSDWLVLSLHIFLKEPLGERALTSMASECVRLQISDKKCQSIMLMDRESRTFEASFSALHANQINEIDLRSRPLQIQSEAISKKKGAHVARYNLKVKIDHRYTQEYEHFYLFVRDLKGSKYQVLKLNVKSFIDNFKKRGGRF